MEHKVFWLLYVIFLILFFVFTFLTMKAFRMAKVEKEEDNFPIYYLATEFYMVEEENNYHFYLINTNKHIYISKDKLEVVLVDIGADFITLIYDKKGECQKIILYTMGEKKEN